jgi:adenylate cyclase
VIDASRVTALINWLMAGAPPRQSITDLAAQVAKRLRAAGLPVDLLGLYQLLIHPEMPGRYTYWTEELGAQSMHGSRDELSQGTSWPGSPAEACLTSGRLVVHTHGSTPAYDDRPDSRTTAERGYIQTVYTPLHSTWSLSNSVARYGTKQPGGFTEQEVHTLRLIQAPLARVVEAFILNEGTVAVLSTYVGRNAGSRVLAGNIRRGDAEVIPSIVLFGDLKGFTKLSNAQPAPQVIATLNVFYEAMETAIGANGGEILKFMGDGLLAIFPTPDDVSAQMAAANGAIASLEEARATLDTAGRHDIQFRAALHLGDIHYGNIGSKARLDFTAIGPAVNLTARLLGVADELRAETVCSHPFHALAPDRTTLLGERPFKGFEGLHQVYGIPSRRLNAA